MVEISCECLNNHNIENIKKMTSNDFMLNCNCNSQPNYINKRVSIAAALVIMLAARKKKKLKYIHNKVARKKYDPEVKKKISQAKNTKKCSHKIDKIEQYPTAKPNMANIENLKRELSLQDVETYRQCLRMSTDSFYKIYDLVKPLIKRKDTVMKECISTVERIAITLRYLSLGETQKKLAAEFKVAQNTISGIIPDVCRALCSVLREKYLKTPSTSEEWQSIAEAFGRGWGFPRCIGVLDGRIVNITSYTKPNSSKSKAKMDHPISLITVVNSDYQFIFADVGLHGPLYAEDQWENTMLASLIENNSLNIPPLMLVVDQHKFIPFVFVASDPFPLRSYIMKPFPTSCEKMDDKKRVFNYRISRPQSVSENTYGILMNRFQIYKQALRSTLDKGRDLILTTICLHNFLMSSTSRFDYCPPDLVDMEDHMSGVLYYGQWREKVKSMSGMSLLQQGSVENSVYAEDVRHTFARYLYSTPHVVREYNLN